MSDSADKAAKKAKAIAGALEDTAHEALETVEEGAHEALAAAAKGRAALDDGAHKALDTIERGAHSALTKADAALGAPKDADLAPLLAATDLPELAGDGALGRLGIRLDREADLYRNVALRELSRVAWLDRVTLTCVLIAFFGEVGVATCAAFTALVGALEGRGGLFALAATILALAPAGVGLVVAGARRMHRELATDALTRSRTIEERLFQLGIVLEWRGTEPTLFQDALARLEATRSGRSRDDGDAPA